MGSNTYLEVQDKRKTLPVFDPGPCISRLSAGCTGYERPSTPGLCVNCDHAHQIWEFSPYTPKEIR